MNAVDEIRLKLEKLIWFYSFYSNSFKMGWFPVWFDQSFLWDEWKKIEFFLLIFVPTFNFSNTQTTKINLNWNAIFPRLPYYPLGCPLFQLPRPHTANYPIDISFQYVFVFGQPHGILHPQLATAETATTVTSVGIEEMNSLNLFIYSIQLKTYEIGNPNWNPF